MRFDKVLCTGGSGRLGRYVTDDLRERCDLTVLDVKPPHAAGVRHVDASILDYAALKRAFAGQEAVVHLAAIPNPRTAPADVTFHTNVQGTWNVLQAAEDAGVRRVVVASSDAALGLHYNPPGYGPQYLPIDEDHPLRPIEFYSLSKEVTEAMCRSYANRGKLEVLAIRPTHIVFPPEHPELRARGADVQNYHLWTYVAPEDVAQGFRRALDVAKAPFQAFFISAADGLNTRPTLDMLRERYGALPPIRNPDYFRRAPLASILDITRAREVLGFEPTIGWQAMAASA
ncbi:MAG TPA: NAD(P)-dependent oxidoreductase [Casimicrobiaceae bacterium]|nr:NAD(P)-dependent oxidoreductase [Casimicrobiaceae bacterium]